MAFDLHTHSNFSDGTQPPTEVVRDAATAGLAGLALTDHDTTVGWVEAAREASQQGIALIRGMEISCVSSTGISVHLLSYLQDPLDQDLNREIDRARQSRLTRAERMTEKLAEDFPITWDLVQEFTSPGATVGRPHLADALVAVGAVPNRSAAFASILLPQSKYYVTHFAPEAAATVEMVRKAGGVPVFAHPMASARGKVVGEDVFHDMIDAGLAGVEVHHRDNSEEGRTWLLKLAQENDLLVTGASDYHGDGKPNRLGENTTNRATVERIAELATSGTEVLWNGR